MHSNAMNRGLKVFSLSSIFQRLVRLILVFVVLVVLIANANAAIPERLIAGSSVPSLGPIVDQVAPAVVNVSTYTLRANRSPLLSSPFFRHFFALPDQPTLEKRTQSAGSGVIVDGEQGFILTNHHVIEGADEIEITLQDGRVFQAKLLGSDEKVDLAVLKVDADRLSSIAFANSDEAKVGDFVLAIGSPFGLQQTVTSGIISALGRNGLGLQGFEDFIQTDASINPGNSGGALIDLRGQLLGINSAILAPAGGNVGIGFAIPADVAQSIMNQLIAYGEVRRGGIGAKFQDLTSELAEAFNLNQFQGALITDVREDSSAAQAGLKQGDIVVSANGRAIRNAQDITNRIGLSPLGNTLDLVVLRDSNTRDVSVMIEKIPVPQAPGRQLHESLGGVTLQDVISPEQEQSVGIIIIDVQAGSTAARYGFEVGDIIFGTNDRRVRSIADLQFLLNRQQPRSYNIRRGYQELILYLR